MDDTRKVTRSVIPNELSEEGSPNDTRTQRDPSSLRSVGMTQIRLLASLASSAIAPALLMSIYHWRYTLPNQ